MGHVPFLLDFVTEHAAPSWMDARHTDHVEPRTSYLDPLQCEFCLSGFDKDNALYVVSAKHVFYNGSDLFDPTGRFTVVHGSAKATIEVDLVAAGIKPHPTADVVVVRIADVDPALKTATPTSGVTFPDRTGLPANFALVGVSAKDSFKLDDVMVGN